MVVNLFLDRPHGYFLLISVSQFKATITETTEIKISSTIAIPKPENNKNIISIKYPPRYAHFCH